jgi:hypothetical protein
MNPGKVVLPYKIDENLRLGVGYNPLQPHTEFKYSGDGFSFAKSTLRCVGVGKCRPESGVPCAPATWSRGKTCIPHAVELICCSRCCRAICSREAGKVKPSRRR